MTIRGYRKLTDTEIELVNRNKELEEAILRVVDRMFEMPDADKRWLAIGRTHVEEGFSALNRAVTRPERLRIDIDEAFDRIKDAELENMIGTTEGRDNGV